MLQETNVYNQSAPEFLLFQLLGGFTVTATGLCWGHEKSIGEMSNKEFENDLARVKHARVSFLSEDINLDTQIAERLRFLLEHFEYNLLTSGLYWKHGFSSIAELHSVEIERLFFPFILPEKVDALKTIHRMIR